MIFVVVITNSSKTGNTDVLGRTASSVKNTVRCFIKAMSKTKPKYLVEMDEFRPVGDF
jgi:hypothetical protein